MATKVFISWSGELSKQIAEMIIDINFFTIIPPKRSFRIIKL